MMSSQNHILLNYQSIDECESWTSQNFPTFEPTSVKSSSSRQKREREEQLVNFSSSSSSTTNNTNNNNNNTNTYPKVTDVEVGVVRSLFGRGNSVGINNVTIATNLLLPFADLRWMFTEKSRHTAAAFSKQRNRTNNSNSNNSTLNTSATSSTSFSSSTLTNNNNNNNNDNDEEYSCPVPPSRSKNLGNLFLNIEAKSENWTRRDFSSSDMFLINSPRSAVTLLRNNIDLGVLVKQVVAAHQVDHGDNRRAAASQQRIKSDSDHQKLAKQRRHKQEQILQSTAALKKLEDEYQKLCSETSLEDVFELLKAEHTKRQVVVSKSFINESFTSPSRSFHYSPTSSAAAIHHHHQDNQQHQESATRNHHLHELEKKQHIEKELRDLEKKQEAATKRRESALRAKLKASHNLSASRSNLLENQKRSQVLSDIEKREAAAVAVRKVHNFDRIVIG